MSNGRSFKRKNIKGSPGKSRRRARQREQAFLRASLDIQAASKKAVETMRESLEEKMPEFVEQMVAATGVSPEQAEDAFREVANAYGLEGGGHVDDPVQ